MIISETERNLKLENKYLPAANTSLDKTQHKSRQKGKTREGNMYLDIYHVHMYVVCVKIRGKGF